MSTELLEIIKEHQIKIRKESIWYLSEEKDKEVMSRVIAWDDFDENELGERVKYWIHGKQL